jgi:hypothetical protein
MSVYNKEHNLGVNNFMKDRKVREYLVKLKKFKHLDIDSDLDDFINAGKIKIEDMVSFYRKMKENGFIKLFEKKKLKLINASKIPDGIITPSDNNILSKSTEYKNYFYEIYWKNNENERKGFMSFSTCSDRYIDMLMGQIVNRQCEENFDIGCLLSQNPIYTGDTTNFGRLTYFVNEFDLYFFDFSSKDYIGRAAFRHYITGLILGSDYYDILLTYKTNIDTGVFADKTIGQEIYYYYLEVYNYDRFHYFKNMHNKSPNKFNSKVFSEYYNNQYFHDIYPPLDGVMYFDHSSNNNVQYPGIEFGIFIPEILTDIIGIKCKFNNKFYNINDYYNALGDYSLFLKDPNRTSANSITDICREFTNNGFNGGNIAKKKYIMISKKNNVS